VTDETANRVQTDYWTNEGGPSWVRHERMYERMLAPFDDALLTALEPSPTMRVLDVGCGFGVTSLAFASRGAAVHGVDLSPPMIERARQRASSAGMSATFAVADAQTDELGGPFDIVVSRFGVMFFDDPVQAFANMADATTGGGRLGFVCWQPMEANPWMTLPSMVVRGLLDDPPPAPSGSMPGPNPFAFGDADHVRSVLDAAGWRAIDIAACTSTIDMGGDDGVTGAVAQALNGSAVKMLLAAGDDSVRARAEEILTERFAPHVHDGTVRMPSAAWLVTAQR
jgi:SAM-dependent methyltransferase